MSTKTRLQIPGLKRITSTAHLEKKIEAVPGVQSVEVDPDTESVVVEHEHADFHKIKTAVAEEGLHLSTV